VVVGVGIILSLPLVVATAFDMPKLMCQDMTGGNVLSRQITVSESRPLESA
jgi:hypothetical protein